MSYYHNLYIYYFSGTGNALLAARWIKENGERENLKTIIRSIEDEEVSYPGQPDGRSLIAFTYPTHGFIAPWMMLKFLWNFPGIRNADVLFVNTRGGFKAGRYFFPGVSGLAQWFSIILFTLRGYKVKGALPLDMPHSWISFFPPNTKKASEAITIRCQGIVDKMCSRVFSGGRYFRFTVWTHLWIDILVSWIVPVYVFAGRFMLAKTLFASSNCNSCKICEDYCPVGAIRIINGMPYWRYNCESCMRCMNICPRKSIQSWVTRICLVGYLLFAAGITYTHLDRHILWIMVSVALFPLYWLFIRLMHVRLLNYLFTYTSLTRYWKRYIAFNVKKGDLKRGHDILSSRGS